MTSPSKALALVLTSALVTGSTAALRGFKENDEDRNLFSSKTFCTYSNYYCSMNIEVSDPFCSSSQLGCDSCGGTWCNGEVGFGGFGENLPPASDLPPLSDFGLPTKPEPAPGYCTIYTECEGTKPFIGYFDKCNRSQGSCQTDGDNECMGYWCPEGWNLRENDAPIPPPSSPLTNWFQPTKPHAAPGYCTIYNECEGSKPFTGYFDKCNRNQNACQTDGECMGYWCPVGWNLRSGDEPLGMPSQ